jgi:hypothetical protein
VTGQRGVDVKVKIGNRQEAKEHLS